MDGESHGGSFWVEEINGKVQTPVRRKRKYRTKKKEYQGWGSTSLIRFLQSIGRDTNKEIAEREVANIVMDYVKQNNLFHKTNKRRIECDEKLHSLFGRKNISRLRINDLLESHYAENCEESSDDLFESEEDKKAFSMCESSRTAPSERRSQPKKPVFEKPKPKSCFAAVVSANIKLVYLKKSLVEELLKDPETFETKVVGSFIRTKRDPNDYLQKNSRLLLQVTGTKKSSEVNGEIHLRASGFIKDITVQMLSDDNFSEEECEDLRLRVKDGWVKRPMTVDMEHKARVLHEDITKHWIATELTRLQNLIDRANEKGWRRDTLDEYLEKREKLQRPDEQDRLLCELPQVIADDQETESSTPDSRHKKVGNNFKATCTKSSLLTEDVKAVTNAKLDIADPVKPQCNSPKSIPILRRSPDVPLLDFTKNSTMWNCTSNHTAEHQSCGLPVQQPPEQQTDFAYKNDMSKPAKSHEAKISQSLTHKQIWPSQIHLSDGLYVQRLQEQPRDFAYKNGTPKSSQLHEGKICQAFPNKQILPSQVVVLKQSDGLCIQRLTVHQTNFLHKNDMSKPAESHEVKISQTSPSPSVQPIGNVAVHPTTVTSDHDLPTKEVHCDASGRIIIRPLGKGWTPNHYAIEAIGYSIKSQFRGPYHHYDAMTEEDQLRWWIDFKSRVTWAPQDEWQIKKVYESKVKKQLCDMLTKARIKGTRPIWIGEQTWGELLNYWDSQKFKEKSSQNKINQSSARGGALHSTGCRSHLDIALNLGNYHEPLKAIQSDSSKGSVTGVHQLHATTKLQTWKDVAGGKSRDRIYGVGDLAGNFYQGMSSLTQPSLLASTTNLWAQNEQLRQKVRQANKKAEAATQRANSLNERTTQLEGPVQVMQKQLVMMVERQDGDTSNHKS